MFHPIITDEVLWQVSVSSHWSQVSCVPSRSGFVTLFFFPAVKLFSGRYFACHSVMTGGLGFLRLKIPSTAYRRKCWWRRVCSLTRVVVYIVNVPNSQSNIGTLPTPNILLYFYYWKATVFLKCVHGYLDINVHDLFTLLYQVSTWGANQRPGGGANSAVVGVVAPRQFCPVSLSVRVQRDGGADWRSRQAAAASVCASPGTDSR